LFVLNSLKGYNLKMPQAGAEEQNRSNQGNRDGTNRETDLWVEQYGDILYRFALVHLQNPSVAEDLVQDTFVVALKSQVSFRKQSAPQTWLIGILKHKIIDHYRSSHMTVSIEETTASDSDSDDISGNHGLKIPVNQCKEWDVRPEKIVEDNAFRDTLNACLGHLPEKSKRIFLMREADDIKSEEICKVFNMTPTNLWVRLHRIRNQLKNCLEKNWFK
jgi:RNA polymerase sigma-70 factor (ECF subfamily)